MVRHSGKMQTAKIIVQQKNREAVKQSMTNLVYQTAEVDKIDYEVEAIENWQEIHENVVAKEQQIDEVVQIKQQD